MGQGHSVYGRAQVPSGLAIDMKHRRTIRHIQNDRIVVDAGATWREIHDATLPLGLAPPVFTDYLDLSVGGTLAVGGIGGASARHGLQCDNVLAMKVVTGLGDQVICSPHSNVDLFDAVRAGLGQVAVIVRATLKLVQAPRQVRLHLLDYPDLATMIADARTLVADARFDAVQGSIRPAPNAPKGWQYRLEVVEHLRDEARSDPKRLDGSANGWNSVEASTLAYGKYLDRLAALEQRLRAKGQWFFPHPWLTSFVGHADAESIVGYELERLGPGDLGPMGQVVLFPLRRTTATTPLLRLPTDDICFAFNLIRIPPTDDAVEARRLVSANRAIYDRIRGRGATLYPVSASPMSPDDWRRHFGAAFDALAAAKRKFDPKHVLSNGYEVFHPSRSSG